MSSVVLSEVSEVSLKDLPMDSWMTNMPNALWDVPLCHLAIPGSHNAITYCLDKNDRSPVDLTQPDVLQKLDKYMKPLIRPFVYKWAEAQASTVREQLDCGVRYCDLRIAHRPNDSSTDLYFYHGVYTTVTVDAVLKEIREWLDAHPREVVIMSFSHFLGLSQELHTLLISTIKNVFTTKLCPKTASTVREQLDCGVRYCDLRIAHRPNDSSTDLYFYHGVYTTVTVDEAVTLRNLWNLGYQVIVSYEHNVANCHNDLWSHIPYWWANKCKAEALIEEFERRKQHGRPGGFFVTGINLTEDLKYICSHPTESLKDMVMSTYPTLLSWVREQRPGPNTGSINIIAGDFVTDSQFIQTVIALNENLLNWTS